MKKVIFIIILALSMALTSCDCGCGDSVDLNCIEISKYNLYDFKDGKAKVRLRVIKYETPEAYIYRYVIDNNTKNIQIVPKNTVPSQTVQEESILNQNPYFNF